MLRRTMGLKANTNLVYLNLAGNKLRVIEGEGWIYSLTRSLGNVFPFRMNAHVPLISGLERLSQLQILDLSDNKLKKVEEVRSLSLNTSLRALMMQGQSVSLEEHRSLAT